MLPAAPKDVGRLSDVFTSALASVGGGGENRLRIPKVRHSVVILVDGLGFENLKDNPGYARFLNSNLHESIRCEFPSTTATSLAGLSTGLRSNHHGLIGYAVFDRQSGQFMNLLNGWSNVSEASKFKTVPALSESANVKVSVIGPKAYESSGFTELTMKGADYLSAERLSERFSSSEKLIRTEPASLTYLYIPELDQIAHRFGSESNEWLAALEELDLVVNRFASKLGDGVGVILTADHGVMDVSSDGQIFLDDFDWYCNSVIATAGDPRCNFVYLNGGAESPNSIIKMAREAWGQVAYVCTPAELSAAGWQLSGSLNQRITPDFYIIWRDSFVGYDRRTAKPSHLKMIGQHGSITDREMRVPFIKFGSY